MLRQRLIIFIFIASLFLPWSYVSAGTITTPNTYAWSNNVGYINFASTTVSDSALGGYAWSANKGWIKFNPALGGVLNNGSGTLSGSAWGEQLGWIDFSGVSINSSTGKFSGTATGTLAGTITFDCSNYCDVQTDWRPVAAPSVNIVNTVGGGTGGFSDLSSSITFTGWSTPGAVVTKLNDGTGATTQVAGKDSMFTFSVPQVASGTHSFTFYSIIGNGHQSNSLTIPLLVTANTAFTVSGIFIPPFLMADKLLVRAGDTVRLEGFTAPGAVVTIVVQGAETETTLRAVANQAGRYVSTLATTNVPRGDYSVTAQATLSDAKSPLSRRVSFLVGDTTVATPNDQIILTGDVNGDGRIDIVDFSIAAFWYKRLNPPKEYDLNGDGQLDLVDFSIMAFYWTG